jgi:nitrilase
MANILSIQINPILEDRESNLKKIEYFTKKFSDRGLDLVVLPEFFSAGIGKIVENEFGGDTICKICEIAKKHKTNIVAGTVITEERGQKYNTSFVIDREGQIVEKYHKIHLYNYFGGREGSKVSAGTETKVVQLDFAKVGLSICFDIRFPVHYNELIKKGAEIIVQPSAWIVSKDIYQNESSLNFAKETWKMMSKTRAFDNLSYWVSSNCIGKMTENDVGIGTSLIIAPNSEIIAEAEEKEMGIFANIDTEIIKAYRQIFPIDKL